MAVPKKCSDELSERATRMALDAVEAEGQRMAASRRVAGQLDVRPEALRAWVKRAEGESAYRASGYDQTAEPPGPDDKAQRLHQTRGASLSA